MHALIIDEMIFNRTCRKSEGILTICKLFIMELSVSPWAHCLLLYLKRTPAFLAGSMNLFLGKGAEAEYRISSNEWFETLICKVLLANYSPVTSVTQMGNRLPLGDRIQLSSGAKVLLLEVI